MTDLAFILLFLNSGSAICVLLFQFLRRGGYVTLPFLTSFMFLIWYLPQAWTLLNYSGVDPGSMVRLFFMSLLCFWALVIGWHQALRGWRRPVPLELPVNSLLMPVFAITIFAMIMNILIERQPPEVRAMGMWTGVITIMAFFASVSVVSMVLSTAMVLKVRNLATLTLFALNLSIYLPRILIYFRRADTFEFSLAIALGLLFVGGRVIPRTAFILIAILGFFFVNGVGQLRGLSGAYRLSDSGTIDARIPTLREISEIDWLAVMDKKASIQQSEVMNAVVGLEAVSQFGSYTLGAQLWDRLVFAYVPGQLIGFDFKRSLMLNENALDVAREKLYFEKLTGTTWTGFVDPYQDFWFFGCLVWWLTGYVMGRLIKHAQRGDLMAYTLYAATITNGVHVTTHFGYYFFSQSVLVVIAVLFVKLWLRKTVMPTTTAVSNGVSV
ncbi:hypothetical protein [Cereibacter sphaeroides]|uniref:hypothetical protein n=1 Tax=Cereibacter sphaeroides TaxID=1063 RepID=UPI003FCDF10B